MSFIRFAILAGMLASTPLYAQNLVLNGEFDNGLAGWASGSGANIEFDWSALDAGANPDSGSVLIRNVSPGASNGVTLQQCVPVNAGQKYSYGGKVRIPSGASQSLTNNVVMSLRWYFDPECTDPNGGATTTGGSPQNFNTWVDQVANNVTARVGARSVEVRMLISKIPAGGSMAAHFDDVYLTSASIFANGFD